MEAILCICVYIYICTNTISGLGRAVLRVSGPILATSPDLTLSPSKRAYSLQLVQLHRMLESQEEHFQKGKPPDNDFWRVLDFNQLRH